MKINNKFTLIKILATIITLGLICIIIIPIVITVLKDSNQKLYDIQVHMIEERAEKWGIDNIDKLSEKKTLYLDLSQLFNEGYIDQVELRDPRNTSKLLNGCILIEYEEQYKKYKYDYIEEDCNKIKP